MTVYLDIGAQRIQRYLARTPDVKGRRGASAWLSHLTQTGGPVDNPSDGPAGAGATSSQDRLAQWIDTRPDLPAGLAVNSEAGEADGVVALRLPDGADARAVAITIIDDLFRCRLPALEIAATWGPGDTYAEARQAWTATPDPACRLLSAPALGDFPALESCGRCRADPALEQVTIDNERVRLCADCLARYADRYRWPGLSRGDVPVGAEHRLLAALGRTRAHVVSEFRQLAQLGEETGNRNHLATVFIDGNRIGALFDQVIASDDPEAKRELSRLLSAATREALREATATVAGDDPAAAVPVIPHVLGGDDLLATVVADRAWRFVTAYLCEFSRRLGSDPRLRRRLPAGTAPGAPVFGASAGVVFAHHAFPFSRAVELAEIALRVAKRAHAGRRPAVSWLDVTRDGEAPPAGRGAWALDDLDRLAPALADLRKVPASGRAVLERLVDSADPQLSLARLREHARRLGRARTLDPFLDGDRPIDRIADALALARWWRR